MKDLQARLDESEAHHQEELAKIRKEHEESEARQEKHICKKFGVNSIKFPGETIRSIEFDTC